MGNRPLADPVTFGPMLVSDPAEADTHVLNANLICDTCNVKWATGPCWICGGTGRRLR